MPDFNLTNHGSLSLLIPLSDAAREWADKHLPEDAPTLGAGIAIEWRYVDAIVDGIDGDGLTINA